MGRPAPARRSAQPQPLDAGRQELSGDETRRQIAEAAYYRAAQRGFEPGGELDDWLEAEAQIINRDTRTSAARG